MKILIEYITDTREASLTTDELGKAWTAIQRAVQDNVDSAFITANEKQITLPWWLFLLAKEAIGYHLSRQKANVEFSADATMLLKDAAKKRSQYREASSTPPLSVEALDEKLQQNGFVRKLTSEQQRNVKKIGFLPAAATFSVPGAGKTTEALAYFCCRREEDVRLLIVCPKNAFAVWEEQVANIFPDKNISVVRLRGTSSIQLLLDTDPAISLITYQQLPYVIDIISNYLTRHKVFMFLDESHRMKRGESGVVGNALLSLAHLPHTKCIMSGTPLPNSVADLLPQFRFLYPEVPTTEDTIKDLITPIYVRTTKSELKIPPIKRTFTRIPLSPAQRDLYQLLCSEIARENRGGLTALDRRKLRALGKSALRLIQLVSNPSLLAKKIDFEFKHLLDAVLLDGDSPKLEYVTTRARELAAEGKKTIIWSSFVGNVELISARLNDIGADYIHGGVEAGSEEEENTREQKIKRFHDDDKAFVLVANPAACSEGISLHRVCHHAIYLDRNYNAAQYLQSEDRIHRLGLRPDEKTTVEVLLSPDTIDDSVAARLNDKIGRMGAILDDPDLNVDHFDPDNDSEFDEADAINFIRHIQKETASI